MTAIPPDYDTDPERRKSWVAPHDVHEMVARIVHVANDREKRVEMQKVRGMETERRSSRV